jgi:hypothetical protein
MKLPNGDRADLGTKLEDYSLNPLHRHGQHKARVFESGFGETYALRFRLTTGKGSATVLGAWIVRHNEDFPRLTTCFIV